MTITYKLRNNTYDGVTYQDILLKENGNVISAIPKTTENADYETYLSWLSDGNTPEEAD